MISECPCPKCCQPLITLDKSIVTKRVFRDLHGAACCLYCGEVLTLETLNDAWAIILVLPEMSMS